MPQTAEKIRRETEERIRRQNEVETARIREMRQSAVAGLLPLLHTLAQQIAGNRLRLDLADANQKSWTSKHPEFTKSEFSPSYLFTMTVAFLLIYIAAYWLDVLLLSHNAKLLVKDFAGGNQTLIYAAIFGVPLVILLLESYFQTQWAVAKTSGQKWLWGILSVLMCVALPLAIVGFSMATTSFKEGTRAALVQNWQLFGKAALAFFAHAAILLGGKTLHEAKNYFVFKIKDKSLERQSNRLLRNIDGAETALTNRFTEYFRLLNDFNAEYAQNRIEPGPFNKLAREEINRVFGYEVIAAQPNQNPPVNAVTNDGGAPTNPPVTPNTAPPVPAAATAVAATPHPVNQSNGNNFGFDMNGEDEVRP